MTALKKINHVAIIVDDIEPALRFWRDGLGMKVTHVEDLEEQKAVTAFLPAGEAEIELVKPTGEETGVGRFLKKHGPGLHHICFEVDDIVTYLDHLKGQGVRLINEEPVIGAGGKLVAFIHPQSTHGVLIELYEPTIQEPQIRLARARQLADRTIAGGQVVVAATLAFLRSLRSYEDDDFSKTERKE
ncbi:MAG: methylmalonyl-CoA epimerase [Chloroflexi bacterium RBG_16_48_8]|nr:MAG: methylmalonyl-CoA epimerase [Chloroflexi bacterium RBG_16_48_8]